MNTDKPNLIFYCQHSLGMGHLVRALTLATTLSERFTVIFLNGGRFPDNIAKPEGMEVINLPPLGMDEDNQLYSQDDKYSVAEAQLLRKQILLIVFKQYRPQVILIELFPFGRKKFAGEIMPLLKAAKRMEHSSPLVFCSLRDIMVNARKDQIRHDNRARWLVDRYFDAILIHADPHFARLEDTFRPTRPLKTAVHYTGFVLPRDQDHPKQNKTRQLVVSAGGGMVGAPLFRVAMAAQEVLWQRFHLPMTLIAGPFLPEDDWQAIEAAAKNRLGLTVHRHVPSMNEVLASHSISVSQCGYNTVMDILKSGIAALVVPFSQGQENEQMQRARRLEKLGLLRMVDATELDVSRFVLEIEKLLAFTPAPSILDLHGATSSSDMIGQLLAANTNRQANIYETVNGVSYA